MGDIKTILPASFLQAPWYRDAIRKGNLFILVYSRKSANAHQRQAAQYIHRILHVMPQYANRHTLLDLGPKALAKLPPYLRNELPICFVRSSAVDTFVYAGSFDKVWQNIIEPWLREKMQKKQKIPKIAVRDYSSWSLGY